VITSTITDTGPYSISLAASGPWVGTYSTALPILLTKDTLTSDAGIYSITATDGLGYSSTKQANVSKGQTSLDFNLGR
jgi:hypothetical protein